MTEVARRQTRPISEGILTVPELPGGAKFYRCALQVNPFEYLKRHKNTVDFESENDYNKAIIEACHKNKIEVIAVTDHYRVQDSKRLVRAACDSGLYVFNGFEAVTKDGVHFLCLLDSERHDDLERYNRFERIIGECGIHDAKNPSPLGKLDTMEFLERAKSWGAVCIAAHVAFDGGLLKKLSGQSCIDAWKNPNLFACAIPGSVRKAPYEIRLILENKNFQYKRNHKLAVLNASDVNDPDDLKKNSTSCFIKMSDVSVEALRQAFLDPESRIRLHSDPTPKPHAEFQAMTWEGGFLNNTAVHFNENLNVLVGGRGTGKSTVVESIRYVLGLDPLGEEARKAHEGVIRHVLQSGTKVSLLVQLHKPSKRCYIIERSVPNLPVVKDRAGKILEIYPHDVIPGVEVFGQHEISELAKNPETRTSLLKRFVDHDPTISSRKAQVRRDLKKSQNRIVDVQNEMQEFEERLDSLPGLEEMQQQFQQAGLEDILKEKSLLVREERLFFNLNERLEQYRILRSNLAEEIPIDTVFVSSTALNGLPNADVLAEIEKHLSKLSIQLEAIGKQFAEALEEIDNAIADTKSRWGERCKMMEETYKKTLRGLQKSGVDGAEFIQLRKQIEELRPLKDKMEALKQNLSTHEKHRRRLLLEWKNIKFSEYEQLEKAAKKVSKKLKNRVRVEVTTTGNLAPLEGLLREMVRGNLNATFGRLRVREKLSLSKFAQTCREGIEALIDEYDFPAGAAERISQAGPDLFMKIEELELLPATKIELNTAPEGNPPNWRMLEMLSTGQKATAILLILLIESDTPLVIDQPEDDLDNRFITEGVVPIMREVKQRRQFVFTTHNANIPVLGDAELILGLTAFEKTGKIHATITREHMGSIDSEPVRELVEEILEGGKTAFEIRRSKYGF